MAIFRRIGVIRRQAGFALLVVLWSMGLMALLVAHLTGAGRSEAELAQNLQRGAAMQAAADGAVAEAIFHALDSSERHWAADRAVHQVRLEGGAAEISIENEGAKINPNAAPPALLTGLLAAVGVPPREAQTIGTAIAEWRVPENQLQGASRGSRAAAYRSAGRDYAPAGEPYQSLDEIGLVLGVTPAIFARIAPHLSIYTEGSPDARVADAIVREALRAAAANGNPLLTNFAAVRRGVGIGARNPLTVAAENVIAVTAVATGAGRSRFERHAVVRLGDGNGGELFRILSWTADSASSH